MPAVASRGRGRRAVNEINMVPFIDVMLVLLIIFMVIATVITPGAINVPTAGKSARPPDNYMIVALDDKGIYSHNAGRAGGKDTPLQPASSEEALVASVRQALLQQPDMPVLLAVDKTLPYQQVMSLMGRLRETLRCVLPY